MSEVIVKDYGQDVKHYDDFNNYGQGAKHHDIINDNINFHNQKAEGYLGMSQGDMKRLRWNEYMRKYNAKKRKEQKERMHKVMVRVGGKEKLYEESDIGNILIDSVNLFIQILNAYNVFNDNSLRFAFNACNDDIVKMYELILPLINQIIIPQTDDVSNVNSNSKHPSDYKTASNLHP